MMNPSLYFREVWNKEETADKNACAFRSKSAPRLPHGKGPFTYTVERLLSGCLVYRLDRTEHNGVKWSRSSNDLGN